MTTPTEAPPAEAVALAEAFGQMMRCLKQHRATDSTDHGVMLVLMVLRDGPLRPSDLARQAGLDLSTVSRHVRSLEAAGHLARTDDPDDRRAFRVGLTEQGHEHVEQIRQRGFERIARIVEDWPVEDVTEMTRLLTRFKMSLAEMTRTADER